MLYIGLMSGTSADGIDAALVDLSGRDRLRWKLLAFRTYPHPKGLAHRIREADGRAALCELDFLLGEAFATAALSLLRSAGVSPRRVAAIGSHGQTVWHIPRGGKGAPSTMQIGEPAVIAERTTLPVVADFRPADVAAGGEGAPLVPLADVLLFRKPGILRMTQNLGGIGNVTAVPPDAKAAFAFDTGPANALIDEAMRRLTKGRLSFDRGGRLAAAGRVDETALRAMLADPHFRRSPPKSTGREHFGAAWLAPWLRRFRGRPRDLVATLTRLTARSIAEAYRCFVFPRFPARLRREVILSGGGALNPTLVAMLRAELPGVAVRTSADFGIPVQAKEAIAFAILAHRTMHGLPGNLPAATGAKRTVVLGKICDPNGGRAGDRPAA